MLRQPDRVKPVSPDVERRFAAGQAAGLDPDTAGRKGPSTSGPTRQVTTTVRSRWLHRLCPVCGHTFRPGDGVLVSPGERVVHDMPGLRCAPLVAQGRVDDPSGTVRAFFEGLAAAWPMPDDVTVVRLEDGHPLLAPPRGGIPRRGTMGGIPRRGTMGGIPRRSCRVCGHSFRPMDHVVLCPCPLSDPRCPVAVHRDLLRQLHCWDEWIQGDLREQCLAFS